MNVIVASDIVDQETFDSWIDNLHDDIRRDAAVLLHHRVAMRVAVYLNWESAAPKFRPVEMRLSAFRSNIISRVNNISDFNGIIDEEEYENAVGDAYYAFAIRDRHEDPLHRNFYTAALSSISFAPFVSYAAVGDIAAYVGTAAAAADEVNRAYNGCSGLLQALRSDAAILEAGGSLRELRKLPLWSNSVPHWWKSAHANLVDDFAREANIVDGWQIWLHWYNTIAVGNSAFDLPESIADDLEVRIAFGDGREDFWERSAAEINREIFGWLQDERKSLSNLLPEIEVLKPANAAVSRFEQNKLGKIAIVEDAPKAEKSRDTSECEEHYQEAKLKAFAVLELGSNKLARCYNPIKALADYLPSDFSQVSINRVWSKANTLRAILAEHEQELEKSRRDQNRDLVLEFESASKLRDCVSQLNVFLAFDEKGRELDRLSFGPEARRRSEGIVQAASPIINNMIQVAEGATANIVIGEHNRVANANHTIHGDQGVERVAQQDENFAIQVLMVGWRIAKNVLQSGSGESVIQVVLATGGQYGPDIIKFVAHYKSDFESLVATWSSSKEVLEIINAIAEIAARLT
jgi:hypothetical protein